VLILAYVRLGEMIWRAEAMSLSVSTLASSFRDDPGAFMVRFGWTGVHAATAWLVTSPGLIALVYFSFRPVLRRAAGR
jgi:hypothetical protein